MKVLLISPIAPPFGGLSTWTDEYVKATKGMLDIDCVNTNYTGKNPIESGKRSITQELARSVHIWRSIRRKCKKTKYDIVHMNSPCSAFGNLRDCVSMLLIGLYHASGANVLHCHCNLNDFVGYGKRRLPIFKLFLKRFDCVLVLNEQSLDYIKEISAVKTVCIPNFISDLKTEEKRFHEAENGLKVLFLGRQTTLKGVDVFIRVAEIARQNGDGFSFRIVGNTSANMEHYTDLPDNIKIYGQIGHDEALRMLYDADVLLFPSRTEGFPLSVLEAMMVGTPVISSDVGAVSQMLENTGSIVLDSFEPNDYYEALKKYLPTEVRQRISTREKERYRTYFSPEPVCNLIIREYEKLLNRE